MRTGRRILLGISSVIMVVIIAGMSGCSNDISKERKRGGKWGQEDTNQIVELLKKAETSSSETG